MTTESDVSIQRCSPEKICHLTPGLAATLAQVLQHPLPEVVRHRDALLAAGAHGWADHRTDEAITTRIRDDLAVLLTRRTQATS